MPPMPPRGQGALAATWPTETVPAWKGNIMDPITMCHRPGLGGLRVGCTARPSRWSGTPRAPVKESDFRSLVGIVLAQSALRP